MLKALKNKFLVAATLLAVAVAPIAIVGSVSAAAAGADITTNLKCGSNLNTGEGDCTTTTGSDQVTSIVTKAINFFSALVGIISVVMIIWGGLKYVTSAGDSGNITAAKNTIMYAVIGLVIVAIAQFIVQFVIQKVTS